MVSRPSGRPRPTPAPRRKPPVILTSLPDDEPGVDRSGTGKRVDTVQNRKRILEAAYEVFAESGVDAQMTDIAEAAGLGVGTLYRNFPSKEALVNALIGKRLRQAVHGAEAAVAHPDAWEALVEMMKWITNQQLENRVLSQFFAGRIGGSKELQADSMAVHSLISDLVERAKQEGHLRQDVGTSDIRMIMMSICSIATRDDPLTHRMIWRLLEIMLDGLKTPARSKLPGKPLTVVESKAVFFGTRKTKNKPSALKRGKLRWPT